MLLIQLTYQPEPELAERKDVISEAEMLLSINPPVEDDINSFREGQVLCSVLNPVDKQRLARKSTSSRTVGTCS